MDLLYFVIFVSALIFIHELGHFSFAKIFGVKVLTFSIGFGPKLVRVRGKETEYCLGILPFGGFVKMLEEGKGEPVLPEDRGRTFEAQSLWKRVVIVLAGPAMNVAFPVILYMSVYLDDRAFLAPTVGIVVPNKPADGKLLPGDLVTNVDGETITSFPELQQSLSKKAGKTIHVTVLRDGKSVNVEMIPADEIEILEPRELDMTEHVARVGILPAFPAAVIGVPEPESPAGRAGLRTFDMITAVNGKRVERFIDLATALSQNRGETSVLTYLRPMTVPGALGGLCDVAFFEPGVATLTPLARTDTNELDAAARDRDALGRSGVESADLFVAFVPEGSSEWRAGLRPGDRVLTLDGAPIRQWRVMEQDLSRGASQPHKMTWSRGGEPLSGQLQLRKEQWFDELGQHYERYVFHTTHWTPNAPDVTVPNKNVFLYALGKGFGETGRAIRFVWTSLLRLMQGRVSLNQVSGPITLYDIAGEAGARGPTYFVWAMAITSVNLGLINLFPVPVLDGGHLAVLLIEAIRRRPVSLRTREIASLVGMSVLVCLMLLAFKNDMTRKWDVVRGGVTELFGG